MKQIRGGPMADRTVLPPGVVNTSFGTDDRAVVQRMLGRLLRPLMKTPARGAAASVQVALSESRAGDRPPLRAPHPGRRRRGFAGAPTLPTGRPQHGVCTRR